MWALLSVIAVVLISMIVGGAGIVTAVVSLALSFRGAGSESRLTRAGILVGALFALWLLLRTRPVDRLLSRGIAWLRGKSGFAGRDDATILELSGEYAIAELDRRQHDASGDAAHARASAEATADSHAPATLDSRGAHSRTPSR